MTGRNVLKIVALSVAFICSVISLYFMFSAGRNQKSVLLILLFTGWVVSAPMGLVIGLQLFNNWPDKIRKVVYWLLIIPGIASVIAYSGLWLPAGTKPAFIFLVAPVAYWIIIVASLWIANRKVL